MREVYPWQQAEWQRLIVRKRNNTLPHALLLTGAAGLGKLHFAINFAHTLLCPNAYDAPCNNCSACALFAADTHPDFLLIQPEEVGKQIKIDQIRDLITTLNNTSQQGGYQVAIIEPADALNGAAANSLLKTLEEPNAKIIIILVTSKPDILPATIRSRCQVIILPKPSKLQAQEWLRTQTRDMANIDLALALTADAPLQALDFLQHQGLKLRQEFMQGFSAMSMGKLSAVKLAADCNSYELNHLLYYLITIVNDLVKIKYGAAAVSAICNFDINPLLAMLAARLSLQSLYAYYDLLIQNFHYLYDKINLNKQLALENLFIEWEKMVVKC